MTQARLPQKSSGKAAGEWLGMAVVGAISVVIDFGVFNALLWLGVSPGWANLIALAVATLAAFIGNFSWTFRHRDVTSPPRALLLFFAVNVGSAAIVQLAVMITAQLTIDPAWLNAIKFIATAVATIIRFCIYRSHVFQVEKIDAD